MTTTLTQQDLPLAPGLWTVDPVHSSVEFTVRHLGLAKVRGSFADFTAHVSVGADIAETSVEAEVALSSVNTNNADRDAHLAGTDFFGVEENPTMSFASSAIKATYDGYELRGDLTIAGVTREVTFDTDFHGTEVYPLDGSTRGGFSATGRISRSAFGIDFDIPLGADKLAIGDKVNIDLEIQVVAPE